jgi:hypothetical protein
MLIEGPPNEELASLARLNPLRRSDPEGAGLLHVDQHVATASLKAPGSLTEVCKFRASTASSQVTVTGTTDHGDAGGRYQLRAEVESPSGCTRAPSDGAFVRSGALPGQPCGVEVQDYAPLRLPRLPRRAPDLLGEHSSRVHPSAR